MNDLDDVERSARRAAAALRGIAAYLAGGGTPQPAGTPGTPPTVLAGEGAAAVEEVLTYLRTLRREDADAAPHQLAPWQDWCSPAVERPPSAGPRRWVHRGDPGE